jgi:hypothetical protein
MKGGEDVTAKELKLFGKALKALNDNGMKKELTEIIDDMAEDKNEFENEKKNPAQ